MINQTDQTMQWITLSPQSISSILYYNLLYIDLNFGTRYDLAESDVYVRIRPVDETCGYVELVLIMGDKLINWILCEDIQRYIKWNVK